MKKKLETTFSIHESMLEKLKKASAQTKLKHNDILLYLMHRIMEDNQLFHLQDLMVTYQPRIGNYKGHHLYLSETEYEFKMDLRRFYKMSVSLALALSMILYLDKFVEMITQKGIPLSIVIERPYSIHKIFPDFSKSQTQYLIRWLRKKSSD